MFNFTNPDNETDSGSAELDGVSFITSTDVGGTTYVFTAGAVDNGISVFALGLNGSLTNVSNLTDSGALNLAGVSGLSTITSNGNTYLIAAGAGDNGLSVFRVGTGGALSSVDNIADDGTLSLGGASRVTSATVGGNAYVFAAGTNDDGISVFRVAGDGQLTSVVNLADTGTFELDGVKGLTTAVIGGNTYLFATGGIDDGLSVFLVAANGSLTHTSSVTDDATLKLDGASDVATALVGGVTYVFVTGTADSGVSAFSVNSSGILTSVDNISDTAGLRLAGATGLSVSVQGLTTYLTVGGTENGLSVFKVNAGGTLTFVDNKDDAGTLELAGTTVTTTATVGGTTYTVAGGSTDDGVSVLGSHPTGQLWYLTQGNLPDARLVYVNSDGLNHTTVFDNTPSLDLGTSFPEDVVLDTAAGLFFVLSGGGDGSNSRILMGHIGSATPPTVVETYNAADDLVYAMHIDPINEKLYVSYIDVGAGFGDSTQGIKVYDYNPTTGALSNEQFLVTQVTAGITSSAAGGLGLFIPRDFDFDFTRGFVYFTNVSLGDGVETNEVYRLDLNNITAPAVKLVPQAQFPLDGDGTDFTTLNGIITDVEIDVDSNRAYFITHAEEPADPAAENAIWMVANASTTNGSSNAVKVTVVGVNAADFYPGDMTLDEVNNILYIETENVNDGGVADDDVIWVFQLDAAGTTATLINTISPGFGDTSNIGGMQFNVLPTLGSLNGTSTQMAEQAGAATVLLTGAPVITDVESDHLAGATVQITGGKFSSNETSSADDHLAYGASLQISGLISGTNITLSWSASTSSLSLTGYDTIANYQAVLAAIRFWSTGDNPTNYGLNTNRTITWTVSDGTPDVPGGAQNSGTTTITIAAVNDAPVNGTVSSATGNEDSNIAVTGLQLSDADANPALQTVSVTLLVAKGILTLLTNVTNGLTSGEITGNGTATVTIAGTLNEINATLAATNGLLYLGSTNINGTDTLTVVTNDGGGTGSGGALSDTDFYTITINGVNDAPLVAGDGTETLAATNEDVANAALTNTVSSLFSGQFTDANDQVTGGSSANAFAGVAVVANGSSGSTGQWQYYNGSSWVNVGAASTAAAVTIAATAPIRFLPATDYNGPAPSLTMKLVDASGGALTNGAVVNTTTSGGSTPYSVGTVVLDHAVTAVNDAPTVTGGSVVSLTTIGEDSAPGVGQTVSSLFSSHFSDAKDQVSGGSSADTFTGVAVTSNTATAGQGVYQYFSGGSWHDLPAVSTASAFVLDSSTLVRFVAAADYSGSPPSLIVHIIEDSSGAVTTGATANLSTTGGSTEYGTAMTLGITVTPTNDIHTGGASVSGTATEDQVLTAVSTMADPDGIGTLHYQWQHDVGSGFVNVGADQSTYTLGDGDIGGVVRVVIYYTDAGGTVESATSAATSSITAFNDAPTGGASITGTATEDQVLTANTTTLADTDGLGTLHYDWQRDTGSGFVSIGAADQATYTLGDADVGGVVRVVVSYTDGQGFANNVTSAGTAAIAGVNDPHTGGVSVSGTATENQVLTANTTTLAEADGVGTLHYQWQRDTGSGFVNVGTDQSTYTLGDADVGGVVRVVVNYTDDQGFAESATSAASAAIANVNDAPTGGVSITGTTTENQVLTANTSTLADIDGIGTLHYQWQRNTGSGFVNVGTDQATYTLGDADVGGIIRLVTSYTDQQGTAEAVTSAGTAAIAGVNDPHTGGASITGTATENQVLTAVSTLADGDGLGSLHYQWQRDTGSGYANVGTDQATYTLGDGDVGGVVRVVVSYTDGQGFAESTTSPGTAAIANINDAPTGGVSITGTPVENEVLTANTFALADADGLGTLHYQWQRDSGSGFVNIGTDQATYTLGGTDVGAHIRVVTSYTDQQGTSEAVTSAGTTAVSAVNDPHTGGVTISGTAAEDQVLTAVSTLADSDGLGTLHYQWQRNTGSGFVNVGTDQATYTLRDADVGGIVRLVTSYVDGRGFAESATSAGTAAIININDAPTGGNKTIATLEDVPKALTTADFGFSDTDGNTLSRVKITALPSAGTFTNNGIAVSAGQFISVADINAGKLKFTPTHNANGTGYAHFTFQVEDNGGTASGGVNLDPSANTLTINVAPVNDAPSGSNKTIATLEDTPKALTAADFGFSDTDGNTLSRVKITALPSAGTFTNNGIAVSAGQFISVADINAGKLKFTPAHNANGTGYAHFTFQVEDNGGTASGGVNLDPSANTLTINVAPVNDAPSGSNKTIATLEDVPKALTAADFGFSDTDGNTLSRVKITALPSAGTFTNNGIAVSAGQFISVADINAGKLKFTPAHNANGYAHFTFQVEDNGGTASGGVNLDPSANTLTINVAPVNDAPSGSNKTIATLEDTPKALTAADFGFSDTDGNTLSRVKITALPSAGTLTNNGIAVSAGQFISVADINAGKLKFTPAHNANGTGYAHFTFQVEDNGGTASGGVNLDPSANTLTINVTPVNDAPALGLTQTLTVIAEDASTLVARKVANLTTTDGDGGKNVLSLTGADTKLFEIKNGALWLKAGVTLDFETNPVLDVTIRLDDPTIGTSYEASKTIKVTVTDVKETRPGTSGNDTLTGTSSDDILDGKGGNDSIKGGAGNDTLIGGTGIDTLYGGAGKDVFVFVTTQDSAPGFSGFINNGSLSPLSGADKRDIVADFLRGEDYLDLSKIDANAKASGDQAFTWKGTGNFSGGSGDLIYRTFDVAGTANDKTIVYGDVNLDGRADFQIELAGIINLTKVDFIL